MTVGRNQSCPCGSGKKYKFCCIHKPKTGSTSSTPINPQPVKHFLANPNPMQNNALLGEGYEDDNQETKEDRSSLFSNLFFNMQNHILSRQPHIKAYKKIRKLHSEITTTMADYLHDGKFTHRIDNALIDAENPSNKKPTGSNSHHILNIELDLDTEIGEQANYDLHFYKADENTNSITEEFLQSRRYRKPEKIAMLEAMNNSTRELYEVIKIDSGNGYVHLQNVFTNQVVKIIDIGMSIGDTHADTYVYRRLLTIGDITFGAGVSLSFSKMDRFIIDFIKRHKDSYATHGEMVRFNELYNRFTTSSEKIRVVHHNIK